MDERTTRVLIADDQSQVRSALRLLLSQQPGVVVVGEAGDMEQAVELAETQRPSVMLLDWELPGRNGRPPLDRLRQARPGLVVIALSGRPEARQAALAAGSDAFVSKVDPPERLLAAVDRCRRKCVESQPEDGHPA
jgi:DNA-binding NarL/FixJ family response regulator